MAAEELPDKGCKGEKKKMDIRTAAEDYIVYAGIADAAPDYMAYLKRV